MVMETMHKAEAEIEAERAVADAVERYAPVPYVVVDYLTFAKLAALPVKVFVEVLETWRARTKQAVGYRFDNSNARFSDIYGREFAFQVYAQGDDGEGMLHVWDAAGKRSVGSYRLPADAEERMHAAGQAVRDADLFSAGHFVCAGCQHWKTQNERGGTLYAGQYCKPCASTPEFARNKEVEGL